MKTIGYDKPLYMDEATAPLAVAAGANVPVSGSAIFAAGIGVWAALQRLRSAINLRPAVTLRSR